MKKALLFAAFFMGLLSCKQSPESAFEKDIEALRDSLDNVGLVEGVYVREQGRTPYPK